MRTVLGRRRDSDGGPPPPVRRAAGLGRGEQLLAHGHDAAAGTWLLCTSWRLVAVGAVGERAAQVVLDRPWWAVDGGAWDSEASALTVTWVDGAGADRWVLEDPGSVPETLRERVSASVVLVRHVDLGPGRRVRVAIRKDLRDRRLLEQVLPGPGTRSGDHALAAAVLRARAELRDQTGMGPVPLPDPD